MIGVKVITIVHKTVTDILAKKKSKNFLVFWSGECHVILWEKQVFDTDNQRLLKNSGNRRPSAFIARFSIILFSGRDELYQVADVEALKSPRQIIFWVFPHSTCLFNLLWKMFFDESESSSVDA